MCGEVICLFPLTQCSRTRILTSVASTQHHSSPALWHSVEPLYVFLGDSAVMGVVTVRIPKRRSERCLNQTAPDGSIVAGPNLFQSATFGTCHRIRKPSPPGAARRIGRMTTTCTRSPSATASTSVSSSLSAALRSRTKSPETTHCPRQRGTPLSQIKASARKASRRVRVGFPLAVSLAIAATQPDGRTIVHPTNRLGLDHFHRERPRHRPESSRQALRGKQAKTLNHTRLEKRRECVQTSLHPLQIERIKPNPRASVWREASQRTRKASSRNFRHAMRLPIRKHSCAFPSEQIQKPHARPNRKAGSRTIPLLTRQTAARRERESHSSISLTQPRNRPCAQNSSMPIEIPRSRSCPTASDSSRA